EVAAAGGHHLFLAGPPGAGKTMLAERLPGLLPPLDEQAALEVTAIHSIAGTLPPEAPLVRRPTFEAPHHSATVAALIGGGSGQIRPGALCRAHRGVLFLDESSDIGPATVPLVCGNSGMWQNVPSWTADAARRSCAGRTWRPYTECSVRHTRLRIGGGGPAATRTRILVIPGWSAPPEANRPDHRGAHLALRRGAAWQPRRAPSWSPAGCRSASFRGPRCCTCFGGACGPVGPP
ncbi:MAG: Magnesium-chelatase (Mg-protoporphyrin chelatase), partial [Frankiales bacterium]|nr:Magnesium-chelatase (Mg-protoporphyrin chelatase) [Frankiales bacterium]